MSKVLALIPARKGSRGIPRKNIRELAGVPLIAWSILAARGARHSMRIVCSTDDDEIAEVAVEYGAEAPFRRPAELSTDEAPTIDAAIHTIKYLEEPFTHLLLLQPTSPLRTSADIDAAINLALESEADAVVGVCEAPSHPYLTYFSQPNGTLAPFLRPPGISLRRQDLPPAFVLNGAIYVNRIDSLISERTFFPSNTRAYVMPGERSLDVDDLVHWDQAERQLQDRK